MSHSESKELTQAKKLIDECRLDKAHHILKNFEEKGGHTLHDIVLCNLLKCYLLFWRGLHKDVIKLADQTYEESLGLGKNLLSVDILLIMANSLVVLYQSDRLLDIIKQGEELFKTLPHELTAEYRQREAYIAFLKGWYYFQINDTDHALKQFELSLSMREELGAKAEIALSLGGIGVVFSFLKRNFNRALNYFERGVTVAEESGNKWCIGYFLYWLAYIHNIKGELDRSIIFFERSLTIFKELNNKSFVAGILNTLGETYRMRGELKRALEYLEQSLTLYSELGNLFSLANSHDYLIQILIDKGDLERAQQYLHDFEQLNTQLKNKRINLMYLFDKALLLKTSSRALNRGKAEEILNQILKDENSDFELNLKALINLCELLLTELRMTNDLKMLEEIDPLIARLIDISEKTGSYSILCETHLLRAKLSLLTFDMKEVQRFLTQAQQIAERFNLTQISTKIANENMDLQEKLDLWEKLKISGASVAERFNLAQLDEQIGGMIQNRALLVSQVVETEVSIHKEKKICLVCRGEVLRFTYICECGTIYCENCARALTNLENVCWACEAPIDYSKPVKPYKEKTEEIQVDKKHKAS